VIKGAVLYKGIWLAPNSQAYVLYQAKDWKRLDVHIAALGGL
jgi:hypothetical protein